MLQLAFRPFTSLALSVRQRANNIFLNSDFSGKLRLQVFSTDMCYQSRMIPITDCNHPRSRLFFIKDRTLSNSRVLNAMPRSQQTTQIYDISISLYLSLSLSEALRPSRRYLCYHYCYHDGHRYCYHIIKYRYAATFANWHMYRWVSNRCTHRCLAQPFCYFPLQTKWKTKC